ncbi:P-loop containing nucleoside triphosphate hydrolase protein [Lipomyces japonicus]|uniref:P-loop containing nucleoside triphosphate hydrolase protein n=1 Tax=Lipomyces japonicus TaxID=56871 RepID=UPI0034CEB503
MTSLNEFAEYVHQRYTIRHPGPSLPSSTASHGRTTSSTDKKLFADSELSFQSELDALASLTINDNQNQANGASATSPLQQHRPSFRDSLVQASNSEYLKIIIEKLLQDGKGECVISLEHDLEDASVQLHLTQQEYVTALQSLRTVCDSNNLHCQVTELYSASFSSDQEDATKKESHVKYKTGQILVREVDVDVSELLEIRVAVVGNVDAGKSTLLGVLTKGGLDDGRGKARVSLFRHKHEIETGRTSSVGMEIMGFDQAGEIVGANDGSRKASWKEIVQNSKKVITFIDLAGHEKYLKTTVFGLMGGQPDFVMLMVGANAGMVGMAKEHLGVALALSVPIFICITKIDMCPPNVLQATINQLGKILRSSACRKMPVFIGSTQQVIESSAHFVSQRICPIFQISSVSGQGLDFVRLFLNLLPFHGQFDPSGKFEFEINDAFSVPFVGTVVSGVISNGSVHTGDSVYVGPDLLGQFLLTSIRSIERKRQPVDVAHAGQSVSFALRKVRRKDVRKGMVLLQGSDGNDASSPKAVREFLAEVLILQHATTIKPRYQAMLHVGAVAQTCSIVELDRPYIRTGDCATVRFRFMLRSEYIKPGQKVLFREGRTRGLGVVKEVFH